MVRLLGGAPPEVLVPALAAREAGASCRIVGMQDVCARYSGRLWLSCGGPPAAGGPLFEVACLDLEPQQRRGATEEDLRGLRALSASQRRLLE